MTEETKKQILLHLPYLFFVYLFDKIAQGFHLFRSASHLELNENYFYSIA